MKNSGGLQEGWESVRLGDALTLINGRAFKPSEWLQAGLPIVRIQNLNNPDAPFNYYDGELPDKFLLSNGELLFAWSGTPGTSFGAHIWRGKKAWLNQHIFKVVFDESVFDKRFLQLAINQNLNEYIRQAHGGAGLAHITKGKFENSELPQPSLDVQQEIVAEIEKQFSRLDEAVAGLKRIKASLKRYKAAVLKAAVEGKLTEEWRKVHPNVEPASELLKRIRTERKKKWEEKNPGKKYKEPAAPDTSSLPELPEGWVWVSLQQVFETITDGDHQPPPQTESGIPFLVIGNVRAGKIDFSDTRFVSRDYFENIVENRIPRKGDILYTVVGSYGIPVLIDTDNIFCVQRHIAILKPMNLVERRYLYNILKSNFVFTQATKCATGTAQKTVPLSGLRTISIPFPSSIEQKTILEELESRLSIAEEIEVAVEINMKRALSNPTFPIIQANLNN